MNTEMKLESDSGVQVLSAKVAPDFDQWNSYVDAAATPDTYYRPQYVATYAENTDPSPIALVVSTGANRFLLPLMLRAVPFSDRGEFDAITPYGYGGVLPLRGRDVDSADARELKRTLGSFCRDRGIISLLVRLHPQLQQHDWLQSVVDEDVALAYHGETAGVETLQWDERSDAPVGLGKGRRSDLSFARRALTVQRFEGGTSECLAGLGTFRTIYEETMERLAASSFYVFRKEYYSLLCSGLGREMCLINALSENTVVGAAMFFAGGEFGHYHLSGSTDIGRQLKAGTLMVIEGARWAKERGCRALHLGGGTHADDSLFRFKQSFGGPTYKYHFLTAITDRARYFELTTFRNNSTTLSPPRTRFFPQYRA
jgi:hypothetical protein